MVIQRPSRARLLFARGGGREWPCSRIAVTSLHQSHLLHRLPHWITTLLHRRICARPHRHSRSHAHSHTHSYPILTSPSTLLFSLPPLLTPTHARTRAADGGQLRLHAGAGVEGHQAAGHARRLQARLPAGEFSHHVSTLQLSRYPDDHRDPFTQSRRTPTRSQRPYTAPSPLGARLCLCSSAGRRHRHHARLVREGRHAGRPGLLHGQDPASHAFRRPCSSDCRSGTCRCRRWRSGRGRLCLSLRWKAADSSDLKYGN